MPLGGGISVGFGGSGGITSGWEKIVDETLTAAATSIDVTGLDISSDKQYMFILNYSSPASGGFNVMGHINGDATEGNYKNINLWAEGGAVGSGTTDNVSYMAGLGAGSRSGMCIGYIQRDAVTGVTSIMSFSVWDQTNGPRIYNYGVYWNTSANMTQLTLTTTIANGFQIGNRLMIFKVV